MRDAIVIALVLLVVAPAILALLSQRGRARGLVDGRLAPLGLAPNAVSSEPQTEDAAKVAPLRVSLAQAKAALERAGGTVVAETDAYVAATFASRVFRFIDDVELRGDGTVTHIRSASRVGHSDFGANRRRVERIRSLSEKGE